MVSKLPPKRRTTSPIPPVSPPPLKRPRHEVSSTSQSSSALARLNTAKLNQEHCRLRIFSWNVNGISPFLDQQRSITSFFQSSSAFSSSVINTKPSLRPCLARWQFPHIVCLQEVKISPTDLSSQAAVRRLINTSLGECDPTDGSDRAYNAHFCLPQDKQNAGGSGGKIYGVCALVRRDIGPMIRLVDWDSEGRVLILEFKESGLVVFNIYAVNGTINPYRDPITGKVIGDRHMRKRIFQKELSDECNRYMEKGWEICIAGDLNIARTEIDAHPQLRTAKEHVESRAQFENLFLKDRKLNGLGLRDSFRTMNGGERKFTYRPRGRDWGHGMDRVDLILVSEKIALTKADILDTEEERGPSDHVPLLVELEVGQEEDSQSNKKQDSGD